MDTGTNDKESSNRATSNNDVEMQPPSLGGGESQETQTNKVSKPAKKEKKEKKKKNRMLDSDDEDCKN